MKPEEVIALLEGAAAGVFIGIGMFCGCLALAMRILFGPRITRDRFDRRLFRGFLWMGAVFIFVGLVIAVL